MKSKKGLPSRLKLAAVTLLFSTVKKGKYGEGGMTTKPVAGPAKLYSFVMKTIDGKERSLSDYRGRALVLVNVASECGFTPQYEKLEALYQKYKDQGLSILGFPANEFGRQEPGTDAEIKDFCKLNYGVTFDLFSKLVAKGPGIHPLYKYLTTEAGFDGDIQWNFAKFLVDKHGRVAARFDSQVDPLSKGFVKKVESLLA